MNRVQSILLLLGVLSACASGRKPVTAAPDEPTRPEPGAEQAAAPPPLGSAGADMPPPPLDKAPEGVAAAAPAPEPLSIGQQLATMEAACELHLVAQGWADDLEHRALFGVCQALALAHVEEARAEY